MKQLRSVMGYATGGIGSWMRRHDGLPYQQRDFGWAAPDDLGGSNSRIGGVGAAALPQCLRIARRCISPAVHTQGRRRHHALCHRGTTPFSIRRCRSSRDPSRDHLQGSVLKAVLRRIAGTSEPARAASKQGFVPWNDGLYAGRHAIAFTGRHQVESEGWIVVEASRCRSKTRNAKEGFPCKSGGCWFWKAGWKSSGSRQRCPLQRWPSSTAGPFSPPPANAPRRAGGQPGRHRSRCRAWDSATAPQPVSSPPARAER